jgi:hypothetical protein
LWVESMKKNAQLLAIKENKSWNSRITASNDDGLLMFGKDADRIHKKIILCFCNHSPLMCFMFILDSFSCFSHGFSMRSCGKISQSSFALDLLFLLCV